MSTKTYPPHPLWRGLLDLYGLVLPRTSRGDAAYARFRFYVHHGRWPTGEMRFSDALFRVRTSAEFRSQLVALTTDKAASKTFIELVVGKDHVIPTYAVLRTADEIWRYDFPETCVIKGSAGSGQVIFKKPGDGVDRRELVRWLRSSHYPVARETNYKAFPNTVIVERPADGVGKMLDYKVHCWRGRAGFVYLNCYGEGGQTRQLWDRDWTPLEEGFKYLPPKEKPPVPEAKEAIIAAAEAIAAHFEMVRVDFYAVGETFFVGEITHLDTAGDGSFVPLEAERAINRLMFGDAAWDGPYEGHGALGAKGPPAR